MLILYIFKRHLQVMDSVVQNGEAESRKWRQNFNFYVSEFHKKNIFQYDK